MTHGENKGVATHNYATRKLYDKSKFRALWEFRGVDGEGGNVAEPGTLFGTRHQYLSLRVGPNLLETGNPLSWRDCFEFLCSQPRRGFIYVAYFFDYDVTMMIRTLPAQVGRTLLDRHLRFDEDSQWSKPVVYEGYQFDYLPHKEFKVRRVGEKQWLTINDVGQFFQSSFLTTLERWEIGTPEERECIRKGKLMRADFAEHTAEIEYYNTLECLLLEQLMTKFRQTCQETGYVPKKWQGPGNLASAMLEKHGIPRRDDVPILKNEEFYNLALAGYYGGRFETTAVGPIREEMWQYDINGAYVALLRGLPCLIHGSWKYTKDRPGDGIWFGKVDFDHPEPDKKLRLLYNLPFRNKQGNIYYPKAGRGVYWSTEIRAAERAGTVCSFHEGWIYENHCNCRWFDFVDDYYEQRLRLGKSAKGMVLKLAGNSIYGKLAQSIGYAPWANPVWAGLITAGCRAMLMDAYSQDPDGTFMLATDGIFCRKRLDLPISKKLGEWEETHHPANSMLIVQPGLYFCGEDAKSRGVERGRIYGMRKLFEEKFIQYTVSHGIAHPVPVPVELFITARMAMTRGKWQLAGRWEKTEREIAYEWYPKRAEGLIFWEKPGGQSSARTYAPRGKKGHESTPYARRIGGGLRVASEDRYSDQGLRDSIDFGEQPDWVEPLY